MNINNTDGLYRLEEKLFIEYPYLRGIYTSRIYFPRFNSSWILTDESIAESIISKYDMRKGFKNRASYGKK